MVGSAWMALQGRKSLHPNNILLLDTNTHLPMTTAEGESQFEQQNVGEGSSISLGDGEVAFTFPAIAMFHTAVGDARSLKSSSYALPLFMTKEHVRMRICYDAFGTHKGMSARSFMCYPLRVRSKTRVSNAALTNGVRDAVLWPEVLFRIDNKVATDCFHVRRPDYSLAYGLVFPNFLAVFMGENDVFIAKLDGLDAEIARRYCSHKKWDDIQHISCNEKYFLAMVLGTDKALDMLLPPAVEPAKKRRKDDVVKDDVVKKEYQNSGDSVTSAYTVCFSLHGAMKAIYDPCFDVVLNLISIATEHSGWQNSEIRQNIAKLECIQNLLSQGPDFELTHDDTLRLGGQVRSLYTNRTHMLAFSRASLAHTFVHFARIRPTFRQIHGVSTRVFKSSGSHSCVYGACTGHECGARSADDAPGRPRRARVGNHVRHHVRHILWRLPLHL